MANYPIHCNACWEQQQESAFRLPCDHCFCKSCAEEFIVRSRKCPTCECEVQHTEIAGFQILLDPIADSELVELRSMLVTVALSNGTRFLDDAVHDLVLLQIEARVVLAQQEHQGTSEKLAHVEQEKAASQVTYEHNLKQKEVENVNLIKKLEQMQEDREQLKATVTDLEKREGHWRSFVSERNHEGPGAGHPGSRSSVRSGRHFFSSGYASDTGYSSDTSMLHSSMQRKQLVRRKNSSFSQEPSLLTQRPNHLLSSSSRSFDSYSPATPGSGFSRRRAMPPPTPPTSGYGVALTATKRRMAPGYDSNSFVMYSSAARKKRHSGNGGGRF